MITPHMRLASIHELTPAKLRAIGLQGLLLDVDCTLKDYYATVLPPESVRWVESLRTESVRLCVLSNGKGRRIGPLAKNLGLPFVSRALKPLPFGCRRALRVLDLPPDRVGMVGDQVFADVLAGRLAGLFTILVAPTTSEEPWFTRIKRPFERLVLQRMAASVQNEQ
jgi:HAD superfamily phosphatase (TIGR01668 family)